MTCALWNRSFVIWLGGAAQSQFGTALAGLALSFLVLHQTGSARQLALTLACTLLPHLLMPFAGVLVDRFPLNWPLIGAELLRGAPRLTVWPGARCRADLRAGEQVMARSRLLVPAPDGRQILVRSHLQKTAFRHFWRSPILSRLFRTEKLKLLPTEQPIVSRHGGRVTAHHNSGNGAAFGFVLPDHEA